MSGEAFIWRLSVCASPGGRLTLRVKGRVASSAAETPSRVGGYFPKASRGQDELRPAASRKKESAE